MALRSLFAGSRRNINMALNIGSALSTREKRIILLQAAEEVKISIYRCAIASGVDPDELTYDWTPGEDVIEEPGQQLFTELKKLKTIEDKLAALPAED